MTLIPLCRVCGHATRPLHRGQIFGENIQYYECLTCDFVQTEEPYWLEKAYEEAINDSDTGLVMRNRYNARIVILALILLGKLRGKIVDFAGGYGLLVRLLRDTGVEALWSDPYCKNLLAKGFESTSGTADLVTAFEAFEHFLHPFEELKKMLDIAPTVLFSTEICPKPAPAQDAWWYYGMEHGQHISLFRLQSLKTMADALGCKLYSNGTSLHIITKEPFPERLWFALLSMKADRFVPFVTKLLLTSKTHSDHAAILMRQMYKETHSS